MRAGELFAGYGGLALAVEDVFHARPAWVAEWEEAPSRVLSTHWPDTPNHRDVTSIDWSCIEPVEIISGGSPCQDVSGAGKRAGMTEGTRSNLWVSMREAIATIRPSLVVWENVRGAYSAAADSELEQEPGLLGSAGNGKPVLRALGRVLGDLSTLGYDAQWRLVRASDVGAPHQRARVFVLAHCADAFRYRGGAGTEGPESSVEPSESGDVDGLVGSDGGGGGADALLPTPRASRGASNTETVSMLPAPSVADATGGHARRGGTRRDEMLLPGLAQEGHLSRFGPYAPAIGRWGRLLGRPAPNPTTPGTRGGHRLSSEFVEWLMGLPEGWVTGCGLPRTEELKALGNGVVPQQATAALKDMWGNLEAI